jgi:hypothetical protein
MKEVRKVFREQSLARGMASPIMGTHWWQIWDVLGWYGWAVTEDSENWVPLRSGITLAHWLRKRKNRRELNVVELTNHWVVVEGHKFCDNHTMEPVFIRKAPHRRKRVIQVYRVYR